MPRKFVKITLAAKCRMLFGLAALLIIGSALVVPWMYMEAMARNRSLQAGGEVTRLFLNEWVAKHAQNQPVDTVSDLFAGDSVADGAAVSPGSRRPRSGPRMITLLDEAKFQQSADTPAKWAVKAFRRDMTQSLVQGADPDDPDEIARVYRSVRVGESCMECHGSSAETARRYQPNQLVGMVGVSLPAQSSPGELLLRRAMVVLALVLAFVLASLTFYLIVNGLILSPVRRLKGVADKVAEGDLAVRSEIQTGDEFEQLGRSFDDMLEAVTQTQDQLRKANRALDLKLNELAEANDALFEANRLKSEFIANVSHELRTPLNSIIGFAELLVETKEEKVRRYGGNILTPARMLLRIINDLLDLARIEAGKVKLTVTLASVGDICETLISLVTPLAQKKDIRLEFSPAVDVPIIRTDAGKVQQILYNLLSNSIKFTPNGGRVSIYIEHRAADARVMVHVADTGPGIDPSERPRIFEKFWQADSSATREHGGTGLGLAIASDLAKLLGGELSLTSRTGEGAIFTMTLPLEIPQGDVAER